METQYNDNVQVKKLTLSYIFCFSMEKLKTKIHNTNLKVTAYQVQPQ